MSNITIVNQEENNEPKNFGKGYLTFPFDGEQFKDFVTGLLGKPQTISKQITGNFEIHLADLQSLFELVNQRVTQQNNGRLLQFTAKIFFTDRSSVQLGSYDELVTYNEVKPIISEAVRLTWDYLIQFSDKSQPEKQVIELSIISASDRMSFESEEIPIFFLNPKGEFRINIQHTARSWGSDIESMLTNQLQSLLKEENKFKSFVRKHANNISVAFAILFFLICIIGAYTTTNHFINSEIEKVKTYTKANVHSADEKLNFLTSYVASGVSSQHYFKVGIFIIIAIFLSIVFGTWIEETAKKNRVPSFVILTRKSVENMETIRERMKSKWLLFFVSIFISVATGIISNIIFQYIV
jgi:hypothetical protein